MDLLETYIREIREIRSSGEAVPETSYYTPLANLLNNVGRSLKPRVRCIINLKNRGAGLPDGGLFTPEQFQKASHEGPLPGQVPSRGAIEVKGTGDDAGAIAVGEQVSRYLGKYRQVLVTNLRDFVLVGRDAEGKPTKLEYYRLAESETAFWTAALHPRAMINTHSERLFEFLKRVMLHSAPIASPKDLAWLLASYARDAKARIESLKLPALASVRSALEEALGLKFEGDKGDHFFRSTLVQTLFYGVFSAWVLWSKQRPASDTQARFDWRMASWSLHVPMIRALFEQLAIPSRLGPLGMVEVLDWSADALNRVDRASFFGQFEEGHAVQYFYEPFLQAFDPVLRKELGVWFTPPEIVQYMVARVDTVLREELGLADGLADPQVYVLDPCCGTGAYLVEVLKRIAETLKAKGWDGLGPNDLKQAAMKRVFGFEILPAPFVVAHLQLGLLLQNLGAPLSEEKNERAGIYLTNALTGWEPLDPTKEKAFKAMLTGFPELLEERDQARHVKQRVPILVVIGNPPYNAFAGVSPGEERGLVEPYKKGLISEWGIKKFNLDDLYVRFFRLAERRIAEVSGRGVVCYISNFSYLSDPSFVTMRWRFISGFDTLWFDCLNGDSRETGKLTPDGKPDPSIFSTEYNREGIRVGTTIGLMVRQARMPGKLTVRWRQFWGGNKRAELLGGLNAKDFNGQYELADPKEDNRFSFRPSTVGAHYSEWLKLVELGAVAPFNGPVERRGLALISIDEAPLRFRMEKYYDSSVTDAEIAMIYPSLMMTGNRIVGPKAREKILKELTYDPRCIVRYPFKPFDLRWCYLQNMRPLFSEPSPQLLAQRVVPDNAFLITRDTADKDPEGPPFFFARLVCDYDCISGHARHFPLRLRPVPQKKHAPKQSTFLTAVDDNGPQAIANLSPRARAYLAGLGITDPDADSETAGLVWMHALAIGYSPAYLEENADGIRQDWPRIPLPNNKELLLRSATLGKRVAALLDTEYQVPGVASGVIRPELQLLGMIRRAGGKPLDPDADLAVTAGWGHAGKDGVTMPGKGKIIERSYTLAELSSIGEGASALGLTIEQAIERLGKTTKDIHLNEFAFWENVPAKVWNYVIGGYQVIKKWLSYRERDLLGRSLYTEEVREVTNMARRIAAIVLLELALDANYKAVKESCYPWGG